MQHIKPTLVVHVGTSSPNVALPYTIYTIYTIYIIYNTKVFSSYVRDHGRTFQLLFLLLKVYPT